MTSKSSKTDVCESPKTPNVPISKKVQQTKTPDPKKYVKKVSLFTDSRQPVSTWYNSYPRKSQTTYKPKVKVVRDDEIGVTKYRDRYGWLPSSNKMKSKVPKELTKKSVKNIRKQLFTNTSDVPISGNVRLTSSIWLPKTRYHHASSKVVLNGTPTPVKQVWIVRSSTKTI